MLIFKRERLQRERTTKSRDGDVIGTDPSWQGRLTLGDSNQLPGLSGPEKGSEVETD